MWKRLKLAKLKDPNVGGHGDDPYLRVYGKNGRQWPRLILTVSEGYGHEADTFEVACNYKRNTNDWWTDGKIPNELAPEATELINEYIARRSS